MLFQSLNFLIFFSIFFFAYWAVSGKIVLRNGLLLAAGIFLYSLWDYRFLVLLLIIILINYFSAKYISKDSFSGKAVFYSAVFLNLIPLIFFKYYNFFIANIHEFTNIFGLNFNLQSLKLLLPIGISFYTFLSLSYQIDVFKKKIEPEANLINYALSISYFPIIMSGPIHRPKLFLDQLKNETKFDYGLAVEGLRQIMTGLFMKVIIADNLARHVNTVFSGYNGLNGFSVFIGSVYFSFQLYFDFGGYSEMAIGISKLLGFRISRNFKYPYLSRSIAEFWKCWHISLTQWFRDYIFLPLSYIISRRVKQGSIFDKDLFIYSSGIIVTWTLTGLWHGAGWNYILWGMIHAVLLVINKGFIKTKKKILKRAGFKKDSMPVIIYETSITFILVNAAWIFFRAESSAAGMEIIRNIVNISKWGMPEISVFPLIIIISTLIAEYFQRDKEFLFEISSVKPFWRWCIYTAAAILIIYYSGNDSPFIYAGF